MSFQYFHSLQSLTCPGMKFYKIIRSSDVEKSKLKLPGKFEKRFGDKLPREVTLDVPSGAKWRVGVEKSDDGVWFVGPGWNQFVDSLGLGHGNFLMFEYDDELRDVFHVVVMGMSASEVDYPALPTDEDPIVVLDDGDGYNHNDDDNVLVTGTHRPVKKRGYHRDHGETIINNEGQIQCVVQGRKLYSTTEEAEQALARAKAFKATEPVFIIALQPSYVSRTAELSNNKYCQLRVPRPFIMAFFDLAVRNVILETHDGRTWPMQYRVSGPNAHFTHGWKQFAEDKCLTTGDVCLFELNREARNALKVAIFRTTGDDEVPISFSPTK